MTTIYTFAQSAIEEARSAGRYGTANLYSGAINSFRNFTGDIPLTFKEVTAGMIKRYEESLLQKGRRHNTISAYMRMLRSIFNQAYQQGIPDTIPADELFRFRDRLAEKLRYLADAPQQDPEGNKTLVRFSRKTKQQYVASEKEGKATGWSAFFIDGKWTEAKK